jgi:anti-sigma regulatory factor (Ser/Thr protein kinase)
VAGPVGSGFSHEAFFHRGEVEFLDGVLGFVREGLADGDLVVVAEPPERAALLRTVLGDDAAEVQFLDPAQDGGRPGRLLASWAAALEEARLLGRGLRGVGEPDRETCRPEVLDELHLHELLVGRAFGAGPSWRLLCPYDTGRLPTPVIDRALQSHREWSSPAARGRTGSDVDEALAEALAAPLRAPSAPVLRGRFGRADLPAVRHTVASWARRCGLAEDQVEVLELAAGELAVNSVVHGGGGGSLALWEAADAAVLEVSDAGRLADPLAGRLPPRPDDEGCSGLYLLQQLCDLVQVRSGATGTTVRVSTWR